MTEKHLLLPFDRIDGAVIYDPLGVRIGKISELLLDPSAGRIKYALISFNAPAVAGEPLPLPWEALHYNPSTDRFYSYVTTGQLQSGPRFEDPAAQTADWYESLRAHYNVQNRGG
jgi:hypothetical protein